jgi:hypothetical protein
MSSGKCCPLIRDVFSAGRRRLARDREKDVRSIAADANFNHYGREDHDDR